MRGLLVDLDRFRALKGRRDAQDEALMGRLNAIVERALSGYGAKGDSMLALLAAFVASYHVDGSYDKAYEPRLGSTPIERLLPKIGRVADSLYAGIKSEALEAFRGEAQDVFLGSCYEIQYDLGGWRPVSRLTEEQLSEVADPKWFDGQRFSDRLWADKRALKRALYKALTDGIAQGKGLKGMSEAFRKALAANEMVVERLIRTEYSRVVNQAMLRAYRENGAEYYEYVAILDERTTETCEGLNGKRFRVDSAEPGVNLPPMHPNCRSSTIPIGAATTGIDKDTERLDYEGWLREYVGG